ncbi:MAG: hypothetical protein Q4D47_00345 [Erysipelotrichaceae bacterium]|nr:hypothetical protein [Erysipelotrichaceae bacterium]
MYHFEYVKKVEYIPEKEKIIKLLQDVKRDLSKKFTIRFKFVGSVARNMITRDKKTNVGYDFDVNIYVDNVDDYKPKYIRMEIRKSIDKFVKKYGYATVEDSTSVLTIKVKDKAKSCIKHSCDFAVVDEFEDEDGNWNQWYIKLNKKSNSYIWQERSNSFYDLQYKIDWLKKNNYWNEVRNQYIENKNKNENPKVKSRSIFAYTVAEVFHWYREARKPKVKQDIVLNFW